MNWRKLTWTALCLPVLATGSARADEDKPATSDAPKAEVSADKPAADAKPAEAKGADETPPPARPGGLLRRGPRQPGAPRPAGQALRAGVGAALKAVEGLDTEGRLPPPGGPDGAGPPPGPDTPRRPLPPPDPRFAPPGGFGPDDGPPPPGDDRGPPPPRRPGEDGPPPPDDDDFGPPPGARPPRPAGGAGGDGLRSAAPRPAAAPQSPIGPYPFAPGAPVGPHIAPPAGPQPPINNWQHHSAGPPDPELQRLNKQEAELDHEAHDLSARYRHTTDETKRGELREKLADAVTRHFELRQKRRQLELERLEKQLDRLRGSLDKRTAAREALIKQRTDQLLGEEADAGF